MRIFYFGSLKTKFAKTGIRRYHEWLKPYTNLSLVGLSSGGDINKMSKEEIQKKESDELFKKKKEAEALILLDEHGKMYSSEAFSSVIEEARVYSKKLLFCVGGYTGFHKSVINKSDKTISLSRMTFTHEMALLILYEQIYRAMKIIKGEQYHY